MDTASVSQVAPPSAAHSPLAALRLVQAAGGALLSQTAIYGQLAAVEWAQERRRLSRMLAFALLGFACVFALMVLSAALVLILSWGTAYCIPLLCALIGVYVLGLYAAVRQLQALSRLGGQAFAATRAEFAADMALLRSKL